MSSNRTLYAQYCDDIRVEQGGKFMMIGCYLDSLVVDSFPQSLSRFCIYARATTPVEHPFRKLIVRAYLDDKMIAETSISELELEKVSSLPQPERLKSRTFHLAMSITPLEVTGPGEIRVEAETEAGSIIGTNLTVEVRPASSLAS